MRKGVIAGALVATSVAASALAKGDNGDQASAEQAVTAIYNQVQARCTPRTPPAFHSINWDNFTPGSWGSGRIHDANPGLGGPFKVYWTNPRVGPARDGAAGRAYHGPDGNTQWSVDLEFC